MVASARASSGARDEGLVAAVDKGGNTGGTRGDGQKRNGSEGTGQQWHKVATVSDQAFRVELDPSGRGGKEGQGVSAALRRETGRESAT